jgi:hypothetical protein
MATKRPAPARHDEDEDPFFAPTSAHNHSIAGKKGAKNVKSSEHPSKRRRLVPDVPEDDASDGDSAFDAKKPPASSYDFFLPRSDDEEDSGGAGKQSATDAGAVVEDRLTINQKFADRLQKTAELQAAQRRKAKYTGLEVPKGLVVAFNGEIKKALIAERSNTGRQLDEDNLLIADALTLLTVPEACKIAADKVGIPLPASALPPADPVDDPFDSVDVETRGKAIARLLSNVKVQDAQQQLIKLIKAVLQRAANAAALPPAQPGRPTKKEAKPATGAMVILGDGEGSMLATSKAKVQKFEADVASDDTAAGAGTSKAASLFDDESVKRSLAACVATASIPSPSGLRKLENAQRKKEGKVHGRGAGKGRGLHPFTGEPKFEEKHPSWQAHTRAGNRQAKLITKALRSKPSDVVEVKLEGQE